MARHELTDQQWEALEPCLPPLNTGRGRKMHDRRQIINGILWSLKTGAPWRDLPEKYGKWQAIYARYRLWQLDGTWDLILKKLLIRFNADGPLPGERMELPLRCAKSLPLGACVCERKGDRREPNFARPKPAARAARTLPTTESASRKAVGRRSTY